MGELVKDENGRQISLGHLILKDLPNYPWLPCPICGGTESCDHTGFERARKALPGLHILQFANGKVN
jgi:hypothetical protein